MSSMAGSARAELIERVRREDAELADRLNELLEQRSGSAPTVSSSFAYRVEELFGAGPTARTRPGARARRASAGD